VRLTFPENLVREPVVHRLSTEHDVVCNIRRADIRDRTGWVILEISGDADHLVEVRQWLEDTGVRVDDLDYYDEDFYEDSSEGLMGSLNDPPSV
jgi:ABC-type methionine transport system ATPase subunit